MGSGMSATSAEARKVGCGPSRRSLRAVGVMAVVLLAALIPVTPAAAHFQSSTVGQLEIDGRGDDPLGVDDTAPRLSWRVKSAPADGHKARTRSGPREAIGSSARGAYLWDSGKVRSSAQTDIAWEDLRSSPVRRSCGRSGSGARAAT